MAQGCPRRVVFVLNAVPRKAVTLQDNELRLTLCPSENRKPLQSKRSRPPKMITSCELQLLWSTRRSQCITKKRLRGTASFLSASAILKKLFTTGEWRFCHESIVKSLCIQRNALIRAVAPKPYSHFLPSWVHWRRSAMRCVPTSCQESCRSERMVPKFCRVPKYFVTVEFAYLSNNRRANSSKLWQGENSFQKDDNAPSWVVKIIHRRCKSVENSVRDCEPTVWLVRGPDGRDGVDELAVGNSFTLSVCGAASERRG